MTTWLYENTGEGTWQYLWQPNKQKKGWNAVWCLRPDSEHWIRVAEDKELAEDFDPRRQYPNSTFKELGLKEVFALVL